jgi:hypothetical protein
MEDAKRLAILRQAETQGLRLQRNWVSEWIKHRGQVRGRYRKVLKYYWLQECGLLQSGPFFSQEEALLFLAHNLEGEDEYLERTICQRD